MTYESLEERAARGPFNLETGEVQLYYDADEYTQVIATLKRHFTYPWPSPEGIRYTLDSGIKVLVTRKD